MRWQVHLLKCLLFGLLPFSSTIRRIKRWFFPYPVIVQEWKVKEFFRQIALLRETGFSPKGCRIVEIGPGWHPVFALLYYLAGAKSITLVDSQRLMDARLMRETAMELYTKYGKTLAAEFQMDMGTLQVKLIQPEEYSFDEALAFYHVEYLAPADFCVDRRIAYPFDLITSMDVMEHIPPAVLEAILRTCHDRLSADGRMVHLIDHCDHWSFIDPRISSVHFLKYGDIAMNVLHRLNPLEYQNRLRHDDYIHLFNSAGFSICCEDIKVDERGIEDLKTMRIHKKYQQTAHDRLAITTSLLVAKKQNKPNVACPMESRNV